MGIFKPLPFIESDMTFTLTIPTENPDVPLRLDVEVGEMLFILGANGTGKSSLMQAFASVNHDKTRRIAAHRQTWFDSGSPDLTGKRRAEFAQNFTVYDQQESARWKDDHGKQRAQVAIYDLIDSENIRAREIMHAVDDKDSELVEKLQAKDSVFKVMNRLLRLANLDISVSLQSNDEIVATRGESKPYSIAKLSDGERNAILIAANVLTVPPGTLLLIDEPERHLHRSIVSPLLSLLLKERPDCAFVVSTHEPLLPVDNPGSRVLLTRACIYEGDRVKSYDLDLLDSTDEIDDELKRTILGERRKIVFVEGIEHSLDKPLYSLLFPNASIVAKASCREVENAVTGIKGAAGLHWVKPFGLVDNDSSEPEHLAELERKGVVPLTVYSIESIYYHPDVQKLVCERLLSVTGGSVDENLTKAKEDALKAVHHSSKHLSDRIAEKTARALVFSLLPKKGEIQAGGTRSITVDFGKLADEEAARLKSLLAARDFVGILKRYPIRESPALDAVAKALSFADREQYEATLRKLLADDPKAVADVRGVVGSLPEELIA